MPTSSPRRHASSSHHRAHRSRSTRTTVHAKTKTRVSVPVQILVATAALFAVGLAAYGFGFVPLSGTVQSPSPRSICQAQCGEQYCVTNVDGTRSCSEAKYQMCLSACSTLASTALTQCQLVVEQDPETGLPNDGVIADGETSYPFARYRLYASGEDVLVRRVGVWAPYDGASFRRVSATVGERTASDVLPAGESTVGDVQFGESAPIRVPAGSFVTMDLEGVLSPVVPSALLGGRTVGVARSGKLVSLGLKVGEPDGGWGRDYDRRYYLDATCADTGSQVFAAGLPGFGSTSFAYKSKPSLKRLPLAGSLRSGDQDLYQFRVMAPADRPVEVKKFTFTLDTSFRSSETVLSRFRLRRDGGDLALSTYQILDEEGRDLQTGTWSYGAGEHLITVILRRPIEIEGSGRVFTLHADLSGSLESGDRVLVRSHGGIPPGGVIGYLTSDGFSSARSGIMGPNIDTGVSADGGPEAAPFWVWSDLSEVPHDGNVGTVGGSRDWIAGISQGAFSGQELMAP